MTVLLALSAALAYGLSDFVGGITSRRAGPWVVAVLSQVGGAGVVLVLCVVVDGDPRGADVGWAVLAGVGNGVGTAFLYRGLAAGRMGVVAPVSAVGAAVVPLVVGVGTGDRPGTLAWVGIVAALPAIWLVAREPVDPTAAARTTTAAGLVDGVLAGVGFGVLFAALGQVPEESGFLPLALNQVVGAAVVVAVAVALRQPWVPREPVAWAGLLCGVLGASASGLFLVATQAGDLSVAAVITSLYPAFTVTLAAAVLRERIHPAQAGGLALCALAVGLIAGA